MSITLATTPALLVLVATLGGEHPESYLPLDAALVSSMAPVTDRRIRWPVQALTIALFVVLLVRAGRTLPDLLISLVLLVSVAVLATALARDLVNIRSAERRARHDAQRRTELLSAVRELPGTSLQAAVVAACATMRSLGFDAAGCTLRDGDAIAPLHLDGIPPVPGRLRLGEGLAGTCIAEDRTIVVGDYQAHPRKLAARPNVGSAVAVPVRVDGRAVGALMGARQESGEPSAAEVEVAEVLAAHLSAVFATDATVRRQRELLERMGQLEAMRSGFVAQVSDELRDPLTVVRGIAETLAIHGPELAPDRRVHLFDRMGAQTDQLRRTIDALLDFSRFQSSRPEPSLEPIAVGPLLSPVLRNSDAELDAEAAVLRMRVRVDADLVRHALELLVAATGVLDASPRLQLTATTGTVRITLHPDVEANAPPRLVGSLVAQLLVVAGATFEPDGTPTLLLPRVEVEAVTA